MHRRLALVLGLLLWSGTFASADEGGFTKGRNVVVVVGVAGDMESEKAYTDQLNALLDTFAAPDAQPKSLTLLVENPAAVTRKLSFPVKVLPDKRDSFLTLKGSNPNLVVAWGHGGMQGAKPVLHVPGPRLLPEDFAALTTPDRANPADFVLYFKGSQGFAKVVSNPQRRVLSSEGEKTFTYDPIGVPLLLGNVPKAADLPTLAALTDQAVGAWYKTRSQAATEQPTLWLDGQPTALPELKAAPAVAATGGTDDAPKPTVVATLPNAWQGLPVVAAADYPDADAVVLRHTVQCVIGDNPQLSQEEDRFIQILTSEGKRVGDLNLAFSPPEENLTVVNCELRAPDGKIERVDTDVHEESEQGQEPEEYRSAKRKFFAVPNVVPGAVLRVHQRRTWKRFPLPKVYLSLPLAGEFPILDKSLEIRVPAKLPFHFAWKNPPAAPDDTAARARASLPFRFAWKKPTGPATDPAVETGAYGTTYRWQFEKVPPLSTDPLQPPDNDPELLATTFGDWSEFLGWYQGLIRETDKATPVMIEKARELTRDCTTDTDKIRALFRYVTDLRYVAVPIGVNAYRPHAAANVFFHRYGDCKDKANLLNTLLVSQGFDAKLVLAPRFTEALGAVPGAAFNHAISHVDLHGQSLWLDSTDDICRFGLLPPGDPGRHVLLIADQEKGLRTLPTPTAEDSTLTLTSRLALGEDGRVDGTSDARATGIMDYALRMAAREAGSRGRSSNLLDFLLKPDAGAQTLGRQGSLNPGDLTQDFTWRADASWDGLVSPLPEVDGDLRAPLVKGETAVPAVRDCLVRAPFLVPAEWSAALQPRTAALFLNRGYPCRIVQRVSLRLPANGKAVGALPADTRQTDGPLQYSLRWSQEMAGTVNGELTLTLAQAHLSPEQTAVFQLSLHALHRTLAQGLVIELPSVAAQP